jgi:hypothetical protein
MSEPRTESTAIDNILVVISIVLAFGALLWVGVQVPGWLEGARINKASGMILVVGAVVILFLAFIGAAIFYAVTATLLEALGVKLKRPAPESGKLTPVEERAAADMTVHVVWFAYTQMDDFGNDINWGVPLAIHATPEAAQAAAAAGSGAPAPEFTEPGRYVVDQPCNLAALHYTGMAGAQAVREFLGGKSPVLLPPKQWYSPGYYAQYLRSRPLLEDECRRAAKVNVWTVYYEDRFHAGPNRETHPVAICLSAAEAEAEVARRGPVEPGADGYLSQGPCPLILPNQRAPDVGAAVVREVLRRVEAGAPGPVPVH